jgi:hypothetical protein
MENAIHGAHRRFHVGRIDGADAPHAKAWLWRVKEITDYHALRSQLVNKLQKVPSRRRGRVNVYEDWALHGIR